VAKIGNSKAALASVNEDSARGVAVYTPTTLALYDSFVLGFSNAFAWRCQTSEILDLYNQHISGRHLDIGVGSGYFLDRCRFPVESPTIALLDLNPHCLAATAKRLRRFSPSCYTGDVLRPIEIGAAGFDSIGLNYLLHCLPGNLAAKEVVFANIKPLLNGGGTVFGATILGTGVPRKLLARSLMAIYNTRGIFSNSYDRREDLEAGLGQHFAEYSVRVVGCVALFSARHA
jgi:hypothetical protein